MMVEVKAGWQEGQELLSGCISREPSLTRVKAPPTLTQLLPQGKAFQSFPYSSTNGAKYSND